MIQYPKGLFALSILDPTVRMLRLIQLVSLSFCNLIFLYEVLVGSNRCME